MTEQYKLKLPGGIFGDSQNLRKGYALGVMLQVIGLGGIGYVLEAGCDIPYFILAIISLFYQDNNNWVFWG